MAASTVLKDFEIRANTAEKKLLESQGRLEICESFSHATEAHLAATEERLTSTEDKLNLARQRITELEEKVNSLKEKLKNS